MASDISVVVCTQDEELNLRTCLDSLAFAEAVFVVDGGSIDATPEIAEELGARVFRHAWSGYAVQKNWALDSLPIKTGWVLFVDADERVTPELTEEILAVTRSPNVNDAGYYIARKLIFMGRWLRHTYWYPDFNLRLFRFGSGRFEDRLVHERVVLSGSAGYLRNDLIHEDHRPIAAYVARLNRYSTLEAEEMLGLNDSQDRLRVPSSFRGDWAARRRALKERVWYRMPFRAAIRFTWTMTVRLGFLDGRAGFIFTSLACWNEWLAAAKLYEMRVRASSPGRDPSARRRM
jgi:glycosyltransferase involved in cell wall biosynthesis